MRRHSAVLVTILALSSWVYAEPRLQTLNENTASRIIGPFSDVVSPNIVVYGGLSGAPCAGTPADRTCNNCDNGDLTQACNTRRIHNNLEFNMSFVAHKAGFVLVTNDFDQGAGGTVSVLNFRTNVSKNLQIPAGQLIEVWIPWREICGKVFENSNCDDPGVVKEQRRLRIGISDDRATLKQGDYISNLQFILADIGAGQTSLCNNSSAAGDVNGACNFIAYPGDGRVFIESVTGSCDLPAIPNSPAEARSIRVFYNQGSFPNRRTTTFTDLNIGQPGAGACSVARALPIRGDTAVGGLQNGQTYFFALGLVDEALNVGRVTNMGADIPGQAGTAPVPDPADPRACFQPTGGDWTRNCHVSQPDEVIGLIEEEFDCFIATAAFGSPLEPHVAEFRRFRNQMLHPTSLGRALIRTYYQWSPPLAEWIGQSPTRRQFARILLWPLWLGVWLINHLGAWGFSFGFLSLMLASLGLQRARRRAGHA